MTTVISSYNYSCGKESYRQIQFSRLNGSSKNIQAKVFILKANKTIDKQIATLQGKEIRVEANTSAKIMHLKKKIPFKPYRNLNSFSKYEQNAIIYSLAPPPKGFRHIKIERDSNPSFGIPEIPYFVTIFDPS